MQTTAETAKTRYLTSAQAARRLGITTATLRRAVRAGTLTPAARTPGGYLRFRAGDVDAYALQRTLTSGYLDGHRKGAFDGRATREAHAAALLETALDAIITMDHDGRVVEFNPAAEHLFGYARAGVLGQDMADLIIPPAFRDRHRRGLATYLATGTGALLGRRTEVTAMRADGSLFPAELTIVHLAVDGPPLFTGYIRDITERLEAAQALRESEERLHTVVANAPIVLFALDRDGIFTFSEGQGLELLGIRPGQHVGRSYFDLYGNLPESVAAVKRALAGEVATTLQRYKGIIFETRWMPTRAPDGTVTGLIGVSADVTERTWVEEERAALLERERQARADAVAQAAERDAIFEALTEGVFVFDAKGKLLRINRAFRSLFGVGPGHDEVYASLNAIQRSEWSHVRGTDGRPLPPDRLPTVRILRGEVLAGGRVEMLVRAADGQEKLLEVSGAPLYDHTHAIVGGVCVYRDVTERRLLELRTHDALSALLAMAEALVHVPDDTAQSTEDAAAATSVAVRRLAALTRQVLGCSGVGILSVDPQTNVLHQVAAAVDDPEQEQYWGAAVEGTRLGDRLGPAALERLRAGEVLVVDMMQPPLRDVPNPFGVRMVLIAPLRLGERLFGILGTNSGEDRHYTPQEIALAGAVGQLTALVLERERLLQQRAEAQASALALREANRRMDDFLSIASHELKTPLTSLKGSIQLVERRLARSAEGATEEELRQVLLSAYDVLRRADNQAARLTRLSNDLVDVSRIQAGHLALYLAPCDLVSIVRGAVEEQRQLVPGRQIDLHLPAQDAVTVMADADRIEQVVTNYLTNAIKYAPPETPVTVGLEVDGARVRVWVRDEGPGIPVAEQEHIWERFYRAPGIEERSGSGIGLGMGLHISRTLVERHHGQVGVQSTPGAGATFWFTLPLVHDGNREKDV